MNRRDHVRVVDVHESRARDVGERRRFKFDLGEAATYGFVRLRERNAAGQVLLDAKP